MSRTRRLCFSVTCLSQPSSPAARAGSCCLTRSCPFLAKHEDTEIDGPGVDCHEPLTNVGWQRSCFRTSEMTLVSTRYIRTRCRVRSHGAAGRRRRLSRESTPLAARPAGAAAATRPHAPARGRPAARCVGRRGGPAGPQMAADCQRRSSMCSSLKREIGNRPGQLFAATPGNSIRSSSLPGRARFAPLMLQNCRIKRKRCGISRLTAEPPHGASRLGILSDCRTASRQTAKLPAQARRCTSDGAIIQPTQPTVKGPTVTGSVRSRCSATATGQSWLRHFGRRRAP
jgi:hypothetical protein